MGVRGVFVHLKFIRNIYTYFSFYIYRNSSSLVLPQSQAVRRVLPSGANKLSPPPKAKPLSHEGQ